MVVYISMCSIRSFMIHWIFAIAMAEWLSHINSIPPLILPLNSVRRRFNNIHSQVPSANELNSVLPLPFSEKLLLVVPHQSFSTHRNNTLKLTYGQWESPSNLHWWDFQESIHSHSEHEALSWVVLEISQYSIQPPYAHSRFVQNLTGHTKNW